MDKMSEPVEMVMDTSCAAYPEYNEDSQRYVQNHLFSDSNHFLSSNPNKPIHT